MASTYLYQSPSSNGTSNQKFTWSVWLKRASIGNIPRIFEHYNTSSYYVSLRFRDDDNARLEFYSESAGGGYKFRTDRMFRDLHAWYHIVCTIDSTESTEADRMKLWVNGESITDFSSTTAMSYNADLNFNNSGDTRYIGRKWENSDYFDGQMAHVNFCDGYAYQASDFGQTDATTGIWKPKTTLSVSYGTNGYNLLFENSGNMGLDSSGNSNNFTVSGSMTQSISTPSNIFANISPLHKFGASMNITNNNLTVANSSGSNAWQMEACSHGFTKGKYYFEYKMTTLGLNNGYHKLGFISDVSSGHGSAVYPSETAVDGGYVFYNSGGSLEVRTDDNVITGYDQSTLGVSFTTNDIMCLAIDKTNNRVYFRKNDDAWIKSADPVAGTNGLDISSDYTTDKLLVPAIAQYGSGSVGSLNFGEGFFGTTAVASANADSNGIGAFEFAPPTGFLSLCSKSINAQEYS